MKTFSLVLCTAVILWPAAASAAGTTIWLETERFEDYGGWTNDAQFVDQMGSPYLLAIGLEGPVADAVTRAPVPSEGTYRLWVRARDWVPEHSPGRFQVILGGRPTEHVFGQSKIGRWIWEDGGTVELGIGLVEVRLRDLMGHYGRCDAMVLCDDLTWRPPAEKDAIAALREQYGGVSRQVEVLEPYDTVVVGGGLAGTFAAVAAARGGCRTALVQNRPVLGGNTSTEVLVAPQGDRSGEPLDPGEGGIIEEVRGETEEYSEKLLALCRAERKLDLFLNTHATGVQTAADGTIDAVEALEVTSGKRLVLPGVIFIDCTGDGQIGIWAGAEHRHGREPRSMYNESRAPEEGDRRTMGGTLRYASRLAAGPVEFRSPDWARDFPACDDFTQRRHPQLHFGGWQWMIEYGGMLDTYEDAEPIRDELLRIIWGMWDHVKNECPLLAEEARDYQLVWVSHVVGKRESARLIGDYVMTEHDIAGAIKHPDPVAYGGWGIDLHPPGGFYDEGPPAEFSHRQKFSIPFRSLYAKDVRNLLMAGRCLSASHAALGATRVMVTCGVQGQAAGTAAALCKTHDCRPREIYPDHIAQLQRQLLKDGCYIIDVPNSDPDDLALRAAATASSHSPPVEIRSKGMSLVHSLSAHERAVMFKVAGGQIGKLWLHLISERESPMKVTVHLRGADTLGDFSSEEDLATATAAVPPKSEGWVEFSLDAPARPGYYYVWLPKTEGLSWSLYRTQPADTARAYRGKGGDWTVNQQCYKYCLDSPPAEEDEPVEPQPPTEEMFLPKNAVNGFARAVRGWPNCWRPDPNEPLPQWIELDFGRPRLLDTVHVSFQSQSMRAEDFEIQVEKDGAWRTVAQVTGNQDRRRVISFPRTTTRKLRLVVAKAQPEMGVCEIRAYDEQD